MYQVVSDFLNFPRKYEAFILIVVISLFLMSVNFIFGILKLVLYHIFGVRK